MTKLSRENIAEMVDDADEPMEALTRLVEQAKSPQAATVEVPPYDDPMEVLEALIDRAKHQEEGAGGEALRKLRDRIERAHWIPAAEPYRRPEGDPLEVLEARARGEEPAATTAAPVDGGGIATPADSGGMAASGGAGGDAPATPGSSPTGERHSPMGRALESSLRDRALPGPVRAEVAARLATLMESDEGDAELRAIWELVVFEEQS